MQHMASNPFWASIEDAIIFVCLIGFAGVILYVIGNIADDD